MSLGLTYDEELVPANDHVAREAEIRWFDRDPVPTASLGDQLVREDVRGVAVSDENGVPKVGCTDTLHGLGQGG